MLAVGSVEAIIVADYGIATNAPFGSWDVDWGNVYNYKSCSAVAVGPNWLLTAAHVADDGGNGMIVVNGTNYYQREIIFHAAADDPLHPIRADLALVRFDKEFSGYYPLYTGPFPSSPDERLNAVMIGYGRTGAVYSTYYTEVTSGNGVKRWGTQKIDEEQVRTYNVGDATSNDGFKVMFVLADSDYEAGVGLYDSGGGIFVKDGGVWKLAGINTVRFGLAPSYVGSFSISVPAYATWATYVMNPFGDLDGDGIANYWEQQYGATTTGLVASADSDSDGFSNLQEYIADTNPTNAASFFEMRDFLASTNQTILFNGSTGREYQVFYATNDLADTGLIWIAAHTNLVWGIGTNSSITVTNLEDKAFYRLRVMVP